MELMRRQGVDVVAATLATLFTQYHEAVAKRAAHYGFPLITLAADEQYYQRIQHPRFGLTREMAPCLDCRVAMLMAAQDQLPAHNAQFIITGDVVGQRNPGQTKRDLQLVDFHSNLEGLVLRPLSAQLLPPSKVETQQLIDGSQLLALQGRARQAQLALAASFGWSDLPAISSGCLLADAAYGRKLNDALNHNENQLPWLELLAIGRHFRHGEVKIILGRNAAENETLAAWFRQTTFPAALIQPYNFRGATALIPQGAEKETVRQAAALIHQHAREMPEMGQFVIDRVGTPDRETIGFSIPLLANLRLPTI
jgi:hypothetical protein